MSDEIIKIIPINYKYIPDQNSLKTLKSIFKNDKVDFIITEDVQFIDQGSNFENVLCNICNKPIDISIWQDLMDKANENKFNNLDFITPCCNNKSSLNDLKYIMSAGFSKFSIILNNPDYIFKEHDDIIKKVEIVLNEKVKIIYALY